MRKGKVETDPIMDLADESIDIVEMIGDIDLRLSQFLILSQSHHLSVVEAQTLKHHANDLIGVGTKVLQILEPRLENYRDVSRFLIRK